MLVFTHVPHCDPTGSSADCGPLSVQGQDKLLTTAPQAQSPTWSSSSGSYVITINSLRVHLPYLSVGSMRAGAVSVCHCIPRSQDGARHITGAQDRLEEGPNARSCLGALPWAGTHDHVMLAQHRHLPQGLVGESVEVVGTVLPPAPALLPACMHQLLCKQARNPAGVSAAPEASFLPHHPTLPLASTWEVLHQADGLWRTGLALIGGAWGVTQQGRFLPGAAVILIGHLSTHTGPATQRTEGYQASRTRTSTPPLTHPLQSTESPNDHLQM